MDKQDVEYRMYSLKSSMISEILCHHDIISYLLRLYFAWFLAPTVPKVRLCHKISKLIDKALGSAV